MQLIVKLYNAAFIMEDEMPTPSRRFFAHLLWTASLLGSSGCASMAGLQDCHFACTNKVRAQHAWGDCYSREERKRLGDDFELGFKRGYYDTAMGKDCRLPPVAPPKYWSAKYQTCEHRQDIDKWFAGYQQGITVAQTAGYGAVAEIPVAPGAPVLNKSGCGACYSPDLCNSQCYDSGLIESIEPCNSCGGAGHSTHCAMNGEPTFSALHAQPVTHAEFSTAKTEPMWSSSETTSP